MTVPNKARWQRLVLGGSVAVMVAVYARVFRPAHASGDKPHSQSSSVAVPTSAPAASSPAVRDHRDAQRRQADQLGGPRDPCAGGQVGQAQGLILSGILWDPQRPMAIINGQMAKVGDELDGYRIVQIAPDRVSVSDGGQTIELQNAP